MINKFQDGHYYYLLPEYNEEWISKKIYSVHFLTDNLPRELIFITPSTFVGYFENNNNFHHCSWVVKDYRYFQEVTPIKKEKAQVGDIVILGKDRWCIPEDEGNVFVIKYKNSVGNNDKDYIKIRNIKLKNNEYEQYEYFLRDCKNIFRKVDNVTLKVGDKVRIKKEESNIQFKVGNKVRIKKLSEEKFKELYTEKYSDYDFDMYKDYLDYHTNYFHKIGEIEAFNGIFFEVTFPTDWNSFYPEELERITSVKNDKPIKIYVFKFDEPTKLKIKPVNKYRFKI